jgi:myo-inositol-1(or 4)-monophosphatase
MQATYKQTAIKAAKQAAKIQLKYFGKKIGKKTKKDDSFFTKADIESTKIIRKIILKEFPKHGILDEELGHINKSSDYKWIIDPLDGTHNFIMNNPLFGISIALEYKNEIILGVIYLPVLKKLYCTEKGKGAFCNGKRIKVSNEKNLRKCLCIFDAKLRSKTNQKINMLRKLAKVVWRFRVFGVAVYHNILVAEGKAGLNIDHDSNPWDHCAALLMVEEAGGKVTDLNGKGWTPYIKDYIATNGKIHDKILNVLKK